METKQIGGFLGLNNRLPDTALNTENGTWLKAAVNVDIDNAGCIYPRFIRWQDGLIFQIDQVLYKCRAASKKVGGGGIRYTVMIRGKESYLFHEGDKWFVEAKEACR